MNFYGIKIQDYEIHFIQGQRGDILLFSIKILAQTFIAVTWTSL